MQIDAKLANNSFPALRYSLYVLLQASNRCTALHDFKVHEYSVNTHLWLSNFPHYLTLMRRIAVSYLVAYGLRTIYHRDEICLWFFMMLESLKDKGGGCLSGEGMHVFRASLSCIQSIQRSPQVFADISFVVLRHPCLRFSTSRTA